MTESCKNPDETKNKHAQNTPPPLPPPWKPAQQKYRRTPVSDSEY